MTRSNLAPITYPMTHHHTAPPEALPSACARFALEDWMRLFWPDATTRHKGRLARFCALGRQVMQG
ncbi:MAG: hypothetical protein KDE35_18715, partial [Geminicoccaceae bacterium]|nr:hypothetical protein [Geminicoccaceae bacterium]